MYFLINTCFEKEHFATFFIKYGNLTMLEKDGTVLHTSTPNKHTHCIGMCRAGSA